MTPDSTEWVVIVYRRRGEGTLAPEVLEVGDEITAQRYFDKLSAGRIMFVCSRRGSLALWDLPEDEAA